MTDQQYRGTVFVVDDDDAIRDSLILLMKSIDLEVKTFPSADEFLASQVINEPGCLVLDIRMPGISGLELQDLLNEKKSMMPIIFMTGHGDIPMAVEAMQNGAVDFLQKPFRDQDLIDRIHAALENDKAMRTELDKKLELKKRFSALTARETEVLALVAQGKSNKVIAYELEVSQRTVEIHRSRVMEKMQAKSLAHLVRMYLILDDSRLAQP